MLSQRHTPRRATPWLTVDKRGDPQAIRCSEWAEAPLRQRLIPGAEKLGKPSRRPRTHKHDARWLERYKLAEATGSGDAARYETSRRTGANPRRDEDGAVGREQLYVYSDPRAQSATATADNGAARWRTEARAAPNRARLCQERACEPRLCRRRVV